MADTRPVALTIAGSDPSGGAGIQADLKTFHQFGVYGEAVVTLLTVQNTTSLRRVHCLPPELVTEQIAAILDDIPPSAAKTGALGDANVIQAIAETASRFTFPLIVDPVMFSKHGAALLQPEACRVLRDKLIPHTYLLTPNLPEGSALTGEPIQDVAAMRRAAEMLTRLGAKNVLIKGGHLSGAATDILLCEGKWFEFSMPRVATRHTHGTGCTYSAAITAAIAIGHELPAAVEAAKKFVHRAILTAPESGGGTGPLNHFATIAEPFRSRRP